MNSPLSKMIAIALLSIVIITACSPSEQPTPVSVEDNSATAEAVYQTLGISELAEIMESRVDDYVIINVHIPYAGEIDGTDHNIAFNDIDAIKSAIQTKDTPVILYCRSGNMSKQASDILVAEGYTGIWDVPGGMVAWSAEGHDIVDK